MGIDAADAPDVIAAARLGKPHAAVVSCGDSVGARAISQCELRDAVARGIDAPDAAVIIVRKPQRAIRAERDAYKLAGRHYGVLGNREVRQFDAADSVLFREPHRVIGSGRDS